MLPMSRLGILLLLGHQFRACAESAIPSLDDSCGDDARSVSWAMCGMEVPDWKVRRADERQDEVRGVVDRSRGDGN
ncbi:hypothetical protein BDP67DRAFT_528521 [Colletotrichum lupini]|nr:hypothetical protein BDP67DRAFT_528521 [Colletotrichum lupini]